jgi:ATP-binding cassette subfamily B protein
LPYLWPEGDWALRRRVLLAVMFLVLAKAATVGIPLVYSRAVDALAPPDTSLAVVVPMTIIFVYGLLRVASAGFGELRDAVFAKTQQRIVRQVAIRTFRHLHGLSLGFHLDRQTGSLSRVIDRGAQGMQTVLRLTIFNIIPTLIELALVTTIIWRVYDWRFASITLLAVALYIGFTMGFAAVRARMRRVMNDTDNEANTRVLDSLLNYETVKYFNNEDHEINRFDKSQERYERAAVRVQISLNMLNFGQALIISLALTTIMLLAARGVQAGTMTVGMFVMVNTYLMQLYQPLNFLGVVYISIRQGLVDMEQMFRLLSVNQDVVDLPDAVDIAAGTLRERPKDVVFEDVRFGYGPDRQILKGVSFSVPAGARVAIVGPTGAGKSTIGRLLFRFYDVDGGRILLGGRDIRSITQYSLRASIGVVPQDTVLFNDTIGYNIGYGRIGASRSEIEAAARAAQLHDFIVTLPDGYETLVGERGLKLSGGEKQRVAIARTLLKNPQILLLDEATSALDSSTEQDIQAVLRDVTRHRTTLVIAHRLSTIVDADAILVLKDGRIVERGTHAELLVHGGLYSRMWRRQADEASEDIAPARGEDSRPPALPFDEEPAVAAGFGGAG